MNGDPTFTELGFRRVRIHAHRADSGNIQIFVRLH